LRELNLQPLPPRSTHCVSKIAERIGISGKTQGRAVEIIQQVKKKKPAYSGKDPRSVAAAALYFACCENNEMIKGRSGFRKPVTQREIAETTRLTEVTIRNRIRDLEKILGIKIPTKSEKIRSLFMYAKSLSSP
jgi:transcription initiation factor TFIIB